MMCPNRPFCFPPPENWHCFGLCSRSHTTSILYLRMRNVCKFRPFLGWHLLHGPKDFFFLIQSQELESGNIQWRMENLCLWQCKTDQENALHSLAYSMCAAVQVSEQH